MARLRDSLREATAAVGQLASGLNSAADALAKLGASPAGAGGVSPLPGGPGAMGVGGGKGDADGGGTGRTNMPVGPEFASPAWLGANCKRVGIPSRGRGLNQSTEWWWDCGEYGIYDASGRPMNAPGDKGASPSGGGGNTHQRGRWELMTATGPDGGGDMGQYYVPSSGPKSTAEQQQLDVLGAIRGELAGLRRDIKTSAGDLETGVRARGGV